MTTKSKKVGQSMYRQLSKRSDLPKPVITVDWSAGGRVAGTAIDNDNNRFRVGGVTAICSHVRMTSSGNQDNVLERRDQNVNDDWAGNFARGAALITTDTMGPHDGPIVVQISANPPNTIVGIGAQVGVSQFGKFACELQAFDANGIKVFECKATGTSTNREDDSALFLGVAGPNLGRVEFSIPETTANELAIDALSVSVGSKS